MTNAVRFAIEIAGGELSSDAQEWLSNGLAEYLSFGGKLGDCLQITATDQKRFRDNAIMRAAELLKGGRKNVTPWQLAGEVQQELARYEPRHGRAPRADLTPVKQALYDACAASAVAKRSREHIHKLLIRADRFESFVSSNCVT